eukprot:13129612-Alexandrium_andersonii.AAC.1
MAAKCNARDAQLATQTQNEPKAQLLRSKLAPFMHRRHSVGRDVVSMDAAPSIILLRQAPLGGGLVPSGRNGASRCLKWNCPAVARSPRSLCRFAR